METTVTVVDEADGEGLRRHMVAQLRETLPAAGPVLQAMLMVPRHRFVPEAPIVDAYRVHFTVVTKRDDSGEAVSSASAPWVVALMLADADLRPGQRVLEIGAGTGYNAALLHALVGAGGRVVTVDIDADSVARARMALDRAGAGAVEVVCADGALGVDDGAPWDRIVVATGPSDIAPAWREQLAPGGLLVVPLRWRGIWRGLVLRKAGETLVAESIEQYGFIPMQGLLAGEREVDLAGDGRLRLAVDADHPARGGEFPRLLEREPRISWTGIRLGRSEDEQHLWTRIACAEPLAGRYSCRADGTDSALLHPLPRAWTLLLADPATSMIAYLVARPIADSPSAVELGIAVQGSGQTGLGERLAGHLRAWDAARTLPPDVVVVPSGARDDLVPPGAVIVDRPYCKLAVTWPNA